MAAILLLPVLAVGATVVAVKRFRRHRRNKKLSKRLQEEQLRRAREAYYDNLPSPQQRLKQQLQQQDRPVSWSTAAAPTHNGTAQTIITANNRTHTNTNTNTDVADHELTQKHVAAVTERSLSQQHSLEYRLVVEWLLDSHGGALCAKQHHSKQQEDDLDEWVLDGVDSYSDDENDDDDQYIDIGADSDDDDAVSERDENEKDEGDDMLEGDV